jgi:ferredoxin
MGREHTVTLLLPNQRECRLRAAQDEPVLLAAMRHGIELPSMCLQGWCLTCAGRVCNEDGDWSAGHARRYYQADRDAGFILLCTATPLTDLVVRTHQRIVMRDFRRSLGLPAPEAGRDE